MAETTNASILDKVLDVVMTAGKFTLCMLGLIFLVLVVLGSRVGVEERGSEGPFPRKANRQVTLPNGNTEGPVPIPPQEVPTPTPIPPQKERAPTPIPLQQAPGTDLKQASGTGAPVQ